MSRERRNRSISPVFLSPEQTIIAPMRPVTNPSGEGIATLDTAQMPTMEHHRYARLQSGYVTITELLAAGGFTVKFLDAPTSRRNMLILRNLGTDAATAGDLAIGTGSPGNVNGSAILINLGQVWGFDVVVPQDDLYVTLVNGGNTTGGLAYSWSEY